MASNDDGRSEIANARGGRYIAQPSGYRAFFPAPLPPRPPVHIDAEMQRLLSDADRALGRLDGSIQTLPHPDLFVFMYVRKEAVLSSQIEGTQASMNDLLKAEAEILDPDAPKDVDEVLNYVKAMNHGLNRLATLPLSIRLITEIHEKLLDGVRGGTLSPGRLRTSQNWIGPRGCTLRTATFVPPPHQEVLSTLGQLELFLHRADDLPHLIKIGLVHAQFETIHPFLDGNGRIGRLLITFLLCQKELLAKPVLYLSNYLRQNRSEYYDRLQGTRERGDWEAWLKFFLRGVAQVANEASLTANKIVELRESHREIINGNFGSSGANASRLLERLYRKPITTVNEVRSILGISYPNANKLVDKMTRVGILEETTGQSRNRIFAYSSYIELFG